MKKYPYKISKTADINVGLIGSGISESRSPLMHMREARAQGFSMDYQLFDLQEVDRDITILPDLLDEIQAGGYAGINVTHPCKQLVIEFLDELSDDAANLGAVNTVVFKDNKRIGHNTDWLGFNLSFKHSLSDVATNKVLQLGAGGAGSAVAYALAKTGIETLFIYDIDSEKTHSLTGRLAGKPSKTRLIVPEEIEAIIPDVDGIINTTPVGMKSHPGMPLQAGLLLPEHWLADVIYFPLETELLKTARKIGCRTMDGSGMAIHQAAQAFLLFTGKPADAERMAGTFFNEFD